MLAVGTAGCASPSIRSFSAQPRRLCPQTTQARVSWSVDGCATLSSDVPIEGLGHVASCGERTISAKDVPGERVTLDACGHPMSTKGAKMRLTASRWPRNPQVDEQVLTFVNQGDPDCMAPDGQDITCDQEHQEVIASVVFEKEEYDSAVVITHLQNPCDRPLFVAHRGRNWTVLPGQTIAVEAQPGPGQSTDPAVSTSGTWILRAPLLDREVCGEDSALPALHLMLNTTLGCSGGGQ